MRKNRPQDCHSEMFCADSYQRNVLYIIIQAYKCQQLFLTFSIFFRTLVFSAFFTCFAALFSAAVISGFQSQQLFSTFLFFLFLSSRLLFSPYSGAERCIFSLPNTTEHVTAVFTISLGTQQKGPAISGAP